MRIPKARHDTVILKQRYAGRVVLPGQDADKLGGEVAARSRPMVVCDVGPGTWGENGTWIPCVTKVGDEVLFRGEAEGREIDGAKYWFTRDCHVFGVIEDEPLTVAADSEPGEREVAFKASVVGELVEPTDRSEN